MKDEPDLIEFRIYEKPTKELIYSSKIKHRIYNGILPQSIFYNQLIYLILY